VASRQQLLDYLRGKEMLLGLDNFEHLLSPSPGGLKGGASAEEIPDGKLKGEVEQSGATKLVADILTTAPAVKIMVTSREALNLQGEWLFPVNGLPFPPSDATENRETTATLEDYSAVQLFEQCARRACPGFSLAAEREDVVRICQMVEGMPLGIELAAAWLKMFSCEKITQELERGLDLLTTSLKDVPDRHRSMRAVFEHSWHLLPETERGVFRRLSVFRGGFRQEAAERVAEASFSILVALREKSLLHLTPAGRYQMHELLRQFVEEKLQIISQEQVQTQKRHSDYYLTFLQQKAGALKKGPQKATLVEISEEVDNVRSSWNWAIEQEKMALNDQVVESLFHYYWLRGNFQEGKEAFEKAAKCLSRSERIQKLDPSRSNDLKSEKLLGKVLARLGEFCYSLGQVQEAKDLLQNSLSINRPLKAYGEMAFSLNILGGIVRNQGEIEEGKQLLQKSLALYEKIGDQVGVANALTQLGTTVALRGEHQEAKQLYQEALALSRKLDNQSVIAYVLNRLGTTLFDLGEYGEAEQSFQKALRISEDIGKQFEISLAIGGLALIAWQSGGEELLKAKSLCEQSLAICRKTGNRRHISSRLCFLGRVACDLGEYQEAQAYYQEGLVILRERGLFWGLLSALNGLGQVACGLEDFQKARSYLQQSLETAMSTQRFPFALDALGVWATVLAREEALLEAGGPGGEGKKARAVELLALVLHHPASWQVFKDSAAQLLAELEAELPPGVVAAALERGKARKLEDVVAKILAEG
jgi:predicted ATPase